MHSHPRKGKTFTQKKETSSNLFLRGTQNEKVPTAGFNGPWCSASTPSSPDSLPTLLQPVFLVVSSNGQRGLVSGPLCAGLAVAPLIALIRLSWPVVQSGGGGMARVQLCQLERTCGMALHLFHGF